MKHLFITVLLIVLLATPVAASSGFGSGWGESSSGWGEEEVEEEIVEEEIILSEVTPEPTPEEEPEPTEEPPQVPNTMQFLIDNGYANAPSGFGEPEMIVDPVVEEPIKTVEVVKEIEVVKEVIVEKVIVYETVYVEKPATKMEWWQTMEAPADGKVEEKPVVKRVSTPDTGGSGLFWLGLAAVILGVAIVARLEGRGE